jgi:hypothetical protein
LIVAVEIPTITVAHDNTSQGRRAGCNLPGGFHAPQGEWVINASIPDKNEMGKHLGSKRQVKINLPPDRRRSRGAHFGGAVLVGFSVR